MRVPDQAISGAKATHEKTLKFRDDGLQRRCATAPQVPTLSDAIGTPSVDTGEEHQDRPRHLRHAHRQSAGQMNRAAGSVADATGNWVDTLAPAWLRPYLRLARLDRPIGSWLLLLPCWWSSALAAVAAHARAPSSHIALFFIGAFAMRGAGCTWNDIVDRGLDGAVERTASRPIPSGQVSVGQAALFLVLHSLIGLSVLIAFNGFTIALGIVRSPSSRFIRS